MQPLPPNTTGDAPPQAEKKKDVNEIVTSYTTKGGISQTIPPMKWDPSKTIADVHKKLSLKLKQTIFIFVVHAATEGFIPTPDQTLDSLHALFGQTAADGEKRLSLCVSGQVYMG
jgi:hypothetical protein